MLDRTTNNKTDESQSKGMKPVAPPTLDYNGRFEAERNAEIVEAWNNRAKVPELVARYGISRGRVYQILDDARKRFGEDKVRPSHYNRKT